MNAEKSVGLLLCWLKYNIVGKDIDLGKKKEILSTRAQRCVTEYQRCCTSEMIKIEYSLRLVDTGINKEVWAIFPSFKYSFYSLHRNKQKCKREMFSRPNIQSLELGVLFQPIEKIGISDRIKF